MGRTTNFFKRRYENIKRDVIMGLGVSFIRETGKLAWNIGTALFTKPIAQAEAFEAAVERYQLTEADLKQRATIFKAQIALFCLTALLVLGYAVYLGVTGQSIVSIFITILVSVVAMACAFRSHFWLFQIKHRKLGCTLQEWLNSSIQEVK